MQGETCPFPCPKTYGKEILYKKFFSGVLVPILRGSRRRRISYAGKHKEARTAATHSDAKHPESLCPRKHEIPRATFKLFLNTFPRF